MSVDKATARQFTCCPGGKRTSSKETVRISGTKRIIEHVWRPHPRGIQVSSAVVKQNGQKGTPLTDVCRAHTEDSTKICKARTSSTPTAPPLTRTAREEASRRRARVGQNEIPVKPIYEGVTRRLRSEGQQTSLQQASGESTSDRQQSLLNSIRFHIQNVI